MESNLPDFLIEMLNEQYEENIVNKIIEGYKTERKVTLRVNTIKTSSEKVKEELEKNNIKFTEVSWSKDALIIENARENDIQNLSIYENGEIYLQSLSSMLPPIILDPKEGEDILDMTAAPGGKTTQIAALTNNKSHITACEMNNIRIEKLKYNVEKQGAKCVYVLQKDSRQIDSFFSFDKILLDAPCSGSGTLDAKNENLGKYFTKILVEKSKKSQITLLKKAIKILKKNEEMVYSTCSILSTENEENVEMLLRENNCEIVNIDFDGIEDLPLLPTKIPGTICVAPTELYEGFYVAKIRRIK